MFLPMLTGVVSLRKECSVVRLCKDFVERSQSLVSKYEHRCMSIDVRFMSIGMCTGVVSL